MKEEGDGGVGGGKAQIRVFTGNERERESDKTNGCDSRPGQLWKTRTQKKVISQR